MPAIGPRHLCAQDLRGPNDKVFRTGGKIGGIARRVK